MLRRFVTAVLLAALCFFPVTEIFSQDENAAAEPAVSGMVPATIPEALRRPRRGEAGRYPVDTIIGPLGAGEAAEDAYRFAGDLLRALVAGNRGALDLAGVEGGRLDTILENLAEINPLSCRLGGGREEADGAVSFLVRFIGREKGIAGELYIRTGGDGPAAEDELAGEISPATADGKGSGEEKNAGKAAWRFDDLVLEEPRDRGSAAEEGQYDFAPYERFF